MTVYDTQLSMVRVTPNGDYRRICNAVVYNQRFTRLHIAAWGGPPNVPVDRARVVRTATRVHLSVRLPHGQAIEAQ